MKTLLCLVVAAGLVACSGADESAPASCAGTATPASGTSAPLPNTGDANMTLVDRCRDDLTCTIKGRSSPVYDGTARLRSVAGDCFFTLTWDTDTFMHKLEKGGTFGDGVWTSDTRHVVLTSGGGILVEDCFLR
jgi:hypothetical protein